MSNNLLIQKILLVDDVPENLFSLESILEEENREFVKANSGDEALKLLLKHDIDLILLDVQMPGMDGFETAEMIRSVQKTKHIPIVFVTAISKERKNITRGYQAGAIDYLFKPLDTEIVQSKVNVLLEISHQKKLLEGKNYQLSVAQRNSESIFSNVEEGICIINQDSSIQPQYSVALEEILIANNLANSNIIEVIKKHLTAEISEQTKEYIELLFNQDVNEEQLYELNPLTNVSYVRTPGSEDTDNIKYLDFKFKRIQIADKISELLITVYDRTARVLLKKQLEETEYIAKRRFEFINILNVEPLLLKEFLAQAEHEVSLINDCLVNLEKNFQNIEKIESVYQLIHSIKGNASLLGLGFISQKAHEFEQIIIDSNQDLDTIIQFKDQLTDTIVQIADIILDLHELIGKMSNFYEHFNKQSGHEGELLITAVNNLIANINESGERNITFEHDNFKASDIPANMFLAIRDILVQLSRNSVAHSQKIDNAKPKKLILSLAGFIKENRLEIIFKDNGQGLQYDKIKQKALESKKFSEKQLSNLSKAEIANLIFESGISTSESADLISGRGVGMGIIMNKVKGIGGAIDVVSEEGKYCQFNISLPLAV